MPHLRNHEDIKKELFDNDPEFKEEYDRLETLFQIQKQIIYLRLSNGLTQKELAHLIGTKQSVISRLESGSCNPNIDTLEKIAKAFGKKLDIKFL